MLLGARFEVLLRLPTPTAISKILEQCRTCEFSRLALRTQLKRSIFLDKWEEMGMEFVNLPCDGTVYHVEVLESSSQPLPPPTSAGHESCGRSCILS